MLNQQLTVMTPFSGWGGSAVLADFVVLVMAVVVVGVIVIVVMMVG